jgi:hypothetical protein
MDISGPVNIFWDGRAILPRSGNATVQLQITHYSRHRLHVVTCRGKNDDYDCLSRHGVYVLRCMEEWNIYRDVSCDYR